MKIQGVNKKGLSEVVTTVFLILISIVAVVLVASFIINMTKDKLKGGTTCFDLRDYMQVISSDYTCYNATASKIVVERGLDNFTISGIVLSLMKQGSSTSITITTASQLPGLGEARTYKFDVANGESVKLGVIATNDKTCDMGTYILPPCLNG